MDETHTYVVYNGTITVPQYHALVIDPGVVVKFGSNAGIDVNGALIAEGMLTEKIVFTAYADDSYGGDTNNNGNATSPLVGAWKGLTFNNSLFDFLTHLNHVVVRYGGANGSGNLYINQADITVENAEISNSSTHGIRVEAASPTITGNRIWGNSSDGVRVGSNGANPEISFNRISSNLSDGIEVTSSAWPVVTNNQIIMNRGYGLRNGTTNLINAAQNWWGEFDASGPYHSTTNDTGAGDAVTDSVTFTPWVNEAVLAYAYTNYSATAATSFGVMNQPTLDQGTLSDEWDSGSLRPDRTMAWDENAVILSYTGLDPSKHYKIRVSYFNGDSAAVWQSLSDGADNPIHASMLMPTGSPVQYEFKLAPALYPVGDITLKFIHDNATTSIRGALPGIWLMEDKEELTPPHFETVKFNDLDGDGLVSLGDEYHFLFSEPMDTSLLVDGFTDADTKLALSGGLSYGTTNQIRWLADETAVIVTITSGFTLSGTETVVPNNLTDKYSNAVVGTQQLTLADSIAPQLVNIEWTDQDSSTNLSLGDTYLFHFDSVMNSGVIQTGTTDANSMLRPEGGVGYGSINNITWIVTIQVPRFTNAGISP